ncbi:MAG: response regulator [Leptolyngbyaceae cyanobacterium HOT.MB2.61]|jgi:twitching motility two-component system response regulator PilG|nr:response regulator [Leptolyngbyaceae cyanobacterium HOT.MB2.61]
MQGKLSEIDIRSILQLIELGQRTGELFVEAYPAQLPVGAGAPFFQDARLSQSVPERSWFVFFLNGRIVYASDTNTNLARLADYLRRYQVDVPLNCLTVSSIGSVNAPEYGYLWALLENHTLTPIQGRGIIQSMVHETLFDLLSLHQGSFIFELSPALSPQLTTLEIAPLLAKTMKQVQEWKQFYPQIQSPDQCLVIADAEQLQASLSRNTFHSFSRYADGKTSIRQIARYLNRDILTVARAIYAYVQKGVIQLVDAPLPELAGAGGVSKLARSKDFGQWHETRTPRVVCIDDGVTIRQTVEQILNQNGYEAMAIANPLDALSQVFQLKPDLILCDIAMPELDGYELCAMLRKSTAFRQIPIVMLTGKDGFIDRVKARMVGATDYLTKPFGESELLMLVEKYVGPGNLESRQSGEALAHSVQNGLEENDKTDATSSSSPLFS